MMRRTARRCVGLKGQASIEFMLTLSIFIVFIFSLMYLGYAGYQRAQIDHSLATLASDLPSGWEQMQAEELVKELILKDTDLDPGALEVHAASIRAESNVALVEGDEISTQLTGGGISRSEARRVFVSAEVSYRFEDAFSLGRSVTTKADVARSYIAYTDYQVS